jgi:hypothetical protein
MLLENFSCPLDKFYNYICLYKNALKFLVIYTYFWRKQNE